MLLLSTPVFLLTEKIKDNKDILSAVPKEKTGVYRAAVTELYVALKHMIGLKFYIKTDKISHELYVSAVLAFFFNSKILCESWIVLHKSPSNYPHVTASFVNLLLSLSVDIVSMSL